jgi:hypothetical protein
MVPAWLFVREFIFVCLEHNGGAVATGDGGRRTVKRHRPRISATATGDDADLTAWQRTRATAATFVLLPPPYLSSDPRMGHASTREAHGEDGLRGRNKTLGGMSETASQVGVGQQS